MTVAPWRASSRVIARPIPRDPPVTSAYLPVSSTTMSSRPHSDGSGDRDATRDHPGVVEGAGATKRVVCQTLTSAVVPLGGGAERWPAFTDGACAPRCGAPHPTATSDHERQELG